MCSRLLDYAQVRLGRGPESWYTRTTAKPAKKAVPWWTADRPVTARKILLIHRVRWGTLYFRGGGHVDFSPQFFCGSTSTKPRPATDRDVFSREFCELCLLKANYR